jgi:hypothetical protein
LFKYLDILIFVEATIYQMDEENEALCEALAQQLDNATPQQLDADAAQQQQQQQQHPSEGTYSHCCLSRRSACHTLSCLARNTLPAGVCACSLGSATAHTACQQRSCLTSSGMLICSADRLLLPFVSMLAAQQVLLPTLRAQ